ncbi:hypothetical protein B7L70_09690, partial [Vulcanisaeta sp. EB80]|uniref:hypothetical protein n=1 Tax=Vulcanisaeta sp. EB80 TaxID=1650660 RepID=UPI0009BDD87B
MRVRVRLPDLILGQRVEDLIFTLKAPLVGWREATRGLRRLRRIAEIIAYTPNARTYGRLIRQAYLLKVARDIEGGASIEAYFQQLLSEVRRRLTTDAGLTGEMFNVVLVTVVMMTMMASIGILGFSGMLIMGLMGFVGLLFMPRTHYFVIDDTDIIGIIAGAVAGVLAMLFVDGYLATALPLLAYGLFKLPSIIYDLRLRASLPIRVMTSFNELLTKPNPTPVRDLSPIEHDLIPLWREAKATGTPLFVGWSNVLVSEYIGAVQRIVMQGMMFGIMTVGVGGAFSIGMMGYLARIVNFNTLTQLPVSIPFIMGMPQGAFYSAIGSGLAGGMIIQDWRLGALLGGV